MVAPEKFAEASGEVPVRMTRLVKKSLVEAENDATVVKNRTKSLRMVAISLGF